MGIEIVWTDIAREDLKDVLSFMLESGASSKAEQFALELDRKLSLLASQPYMGQASERRKGVRAILITPNIRLYYRIARKQLQLLGFFDNRMDSGRNPFS